MRKEIEGTSKKKRKKHKFAVEDRVLLSAEALARQTAEYKLEENKPASMWKRELTASSTSGHILTS